MDFSANNNNVTLSAAAGFNGTGSGTRTLNLGNGLWVLSAVNASWTMTTTTGLTFNANSSSISFTGASSVNRTFGGGGLAYNSVSFGANSSGGIVSIAGANTFATLLIPAPNAIQLPTGTTQIITNAFSFVGSPGSMIFITSSATAATATLSVGSGAPLFAWSGLRGVACTGGATFAAGNSFDLGLNTGITITPPGLLVNPGMSGGMA